MIADAVYFAVRAVLGAFVAVLSIIVSSIAALVWLLLSVICVVVRCFEAVVGGLESGRH